MFSLTQLFAPTLDTLLGSLTKLETKLHAHADKALTKATLAADKANDVVAKAALKAAASRNEAMAQADAADRARRVAQKVRGLID